ncbi:MAG: MBL fold metallo-hydrolase [Myxococcota bacterium]|nr:MBL fold metallo-hydrolase [Myxococcota bacterium]
MPNNLFVPNAQAKIHLRNEGDLQVWFLGVGSAFAASMFQSNLIVVKGDSHLMIDLGSKASVALHEAGLTTLDIENLLVTHSHADHIGGMEEWCLRARYAAPSIKGCARGEYRPALLTTADYGHILWECSLRGGLEHSEETQPGRRLSLSDYVSLRYGTYVPGFGRPVYQMKVGEGASAIELKIVRTNHIPDTSKSWQTAFYSVGVIIDERIMFSGDTMFDLEFLDVFGTHCDVIFHDCQDFTGGVHASFEELCILPKKIKKKMILYHLPDGIHKKFDPAAHGFAGWAKAWRDGSYVFPRR